MVGVGAHESVRAQADNRTTFGLCGCAWMCACDVSQQSPKEFAGIIRLRTKSLYLFVFRVQNRHVLCGFNFRKSCCALLLRPPRLLLTLSIYCSRLAISFHIIFRVSISIYRVSRWFDLNGCDGVNDQCAHTHRRYRFRTVVDRQQRTCMRLNSETNKLVHRMFIAARSLEVHFVSVCSSVDRYQTLRRMCVNEF